MSDQYEELAGSSFTHVTIEETWVKTDGIVYHKWRFNGQGGWRLDPTAFKEIPVVILPPKNYREIAELLRPHEKGDHYEVPPDIYREVLHLYGVRYSDIERKIGKNVAVFHPIDNKPVLVAINE